MPIAIVSVSDKSGLGEFCRGLENLGFKILSTGGTAKTLYQEGVGATEVADHTGFPEMLDGRVKTLHPKVHGGILARRDVLAHMTAIEKAGIKTIDLVVVNLYPFAATVARPDCTLEDAIENIDIGGPAMVRSAAKNWKYVAVVTDPNDYLWILEELKATNGKLSDATRFKLAQKAFSHTAAYDGAISNYLTALDAPDGKAKFFPSQLNLNFELVERLRYGENPHQVGAFYRDINPVTGSLANYQQLQGKELSYNNLADSDAAWECVKQFGALACVIVKHANPCGVAESTHSLEVSYRRAYATDSISAYGGIIAVNREMDDITARTIISKQFAEVIIAPSFTQEALRVFSEKASIRVLAVPMEAGAMAFDMKRIGGGLLVQSPDIYRVVAEELVAVTKVQPTTAQISDLLFAWRVAKFVKSNAIIFCRDGQTLGVGAGQMSRIDSAHIAAIKAQKFGISLDGSVGASDAFFPFRDGLDAVAKEGAKAVIQPGGSVRDKEVIAAADEWGIAMVFTGVRHFRH